MTLEVPAHGGQGRQRSPLLDDAGGNTSPVEFELPELEVQSVFTTAQIPDGGSILLGGLTDIRNVERRAEIPWLARIPLVGFFFKSEATTMRTSHSSS